MLRCRSHVMQITEINRHTDAAEICEFVHRHWHAPHIVVRGKLYHPAEADGFVVRREGSIIGLITYLIEGDSILVLTHNSTEAGMGIGSKLVLRVIEEARRRGARRIWLTTTNDNLKSLGFFQRLGFRMSVIYPDAVNEARQKIKPELPETGYYGLPIRDEIELELVLDY